MRSILRDEKKLSMAALADVAQGVGAGKHIEVWFQDEARVGQKNGLTRRWARRGSRPSAPHDQRTASAYLFGAICPKEGKGAALVLPHCNTEAVNLHLAEVATAGPLTLRTCAGRVRPRWPCSAGPRKGCAATLNAAGSSRLLAWPACWAQPRAGRGQSFAVGSRNGPDKVGAAIAVFCRCRRTSSRAIWLRWTSSGPSAMRSRRAIA